MPKKQEKITERIYYKNVSLTRSLENEGNVSVDQIKAARSLLNWSQADLAKKSGYSLPTINNIERGQYEAHSATMDDIIQTFEQEGVQFIDGPGVRIDNSDMRIKCYEGVDALHYLFMKISLSLGKNGGELYISGIDEKKLKEAGGEDLHQLQQNLGTNVSIKILCNKKQSDGLEFKNFKKKTVDDAVSLIPCFIYNGRVAITLLQNPTHVAILYNEVLEKSHIYNFNYIWNTQK